MKFGRQMIALGESLSWEAIFSGKQCPRLWPAVATGAGFAGSGCVPTTQ